MNIEKMTFDEKALIAGEILLSMAEDWEHMNDDDDTKACAEYPQDTLPSFDELASAFYGWASDLPPFTKSL